MKNRDYTKADARSRYQLPVERKEHAEPKKKVSDSRRMWRAEAAYQSKLMGGRRV